MENRKTILEAHFKNLENEIEREIESIKINLDEMFEIIKKDFVEIKKEIIELKEI